MHSLKERLQRAPKVFFRSPEELELLSQRRLESAWLTHNYFLRLEDERIQQGKGLDYKEMEASLIAYRELLDARTSNCYSHSLLDRLSRTAEYLLTGFETV